MKRIPSVLIAATAALLCGWQIGTRETRVDAEITASDASSAVDDSAFADITLKIPAWNAAAIFTEDMSDPDVFVPPGTAVNDFRFSSAIPDAIVPNRPVGRRAHRADDSIFPDGIDNPDLKSGWGWLADDVFALQDSRKADDRRNGATTPDPLWMLPDRERIPGISSDGRIGNQSPDPFGAWTSGTDLKTSPKR